MQVAISNKGRKNVYMECAMTKMLQIMPNTSKTQDVLTKTDTVMDNENNQKRKIPK
jgi:hypothetical protein